MVKVMAKVKPDGHIWGLEVNRYVWCRQKMSQQHPITIYRTGLWFALFWCWLLLGAVVYCYLDIILFHHGFYHDSCDYYWDLYGHYLLFNYTFRLSVTKQFWICKCATPWMPRWFRLWIFSLNIGLNMLHSDSFMSFCHSDIFYSMA